MCLRVRPQSVCLFYFCKRPRQCRLFYLSHFNEQQLGLLMRSWVRYIRTLIHPALYFLFAPSTISSRLSFLGLLHAGRPSHSTSFLSTPSLFPKTLRNTHAHTRTCIHTLSQKHAHAHARTHTPPYQALHSVIRCTGVLALYHPLLPLPNPTPLLHCTPLRLFGFSELLNLDSSLPAVPNKTPGSKQSLGAASIWPCENNNIQNDLS